MESTAGQQAFVVVAAQIIPVLILALLADPLTRLDRAQGGRTVDSGYILLALLAGVSGEYIALSAIPVGMIPVDVFVAACMAVIAYVILRPHVRQHFGAILNPISLKVQSVMKLIGFAALMLFLAFNGLSAASLWFQILFGLFSLLVTFRLVANAWVVITGRTLLPFLGNFNARLEQKDQRDGGGTSSD